MLDKPIAVEMAPIISLSDQISVGTAQDKVSLVEDIFLSLADLPLAMLITFGYREISRLSDENRSSDGLCPERAG
jgi:hypothetical protein